MSEPLDDLVITYGVKELLTEIRDDVKGVRAELSSKASNERVDAIEARVSALEILRAKAYGAVFAAALFGGGAGFGLGELLK